MDPKISQCSIVNVNDSAALPKTFTFDGVYYTDSTTEQIYNEIAYPLVEVCISIYYLCIRGIVRDPTSKFKGTWYGIMKTVVYFRYALCALHT